jgi:hypothetical protein
MWGDRTWGEAAYAEPADLTIPPFQDRRGSAEISITAAAVGVQLDPGVGAAALGFATSGAGAFSRQKVRVIQTAPRSGRSRTGLSHSGFNNESI